MKLIAGWIAQALRNADALAAIKKQVHRPDGQVSLADYVRSRLAFRVDDLDACQGRNTG